MAGKQADIKVGVITNYDDKGINQAKTGLAGFSNSIKDAEGVGGKFAAGWGNIKEQVTAHAGALAVAGGAALIAFGVKAVGAFTDTAKAALDMGAATGLSTEQASRWIAVADDMGVSAEALQAGIGKIGKTLDGAQWKTYGIATRDAGGEARATNDILLDSLDTLGRIPNETERAKAGNALFGKGYANLAPLIGKTREEMEKYLGSVEKGQVITAAEAKKAEKFRLAQDQLGDALKDVTIAIGEQVAALAPLLVKAAQLLTFVTGASEGSSDFGDELARLAKQYKLTGDQQQDYFTDLYTGKTTIEEVRKELEAAAIATAVAARSTEDHAAALKLQALNTGQARDETHDLTGAEGDLKDATAEATRKSDAFATSLQGQIDKLEDLYPKEYNAVTAKYDYADAQAAAMIAVDNLNTTLGDNKSKQEDVDTATRNARDAILDQSEKFATLDGAALGSEGAIRRQITSLEAQRDTLAPGSPLRAFLDQYIADLKAIPSNIDTFMNLHVSSSAVNPGAPGYLPPGIGGVAHGAEGGIVKARPGGQLLVAGEAGSDEALVPLDGQHGLGGSTTINIYPQFMPTPKQLANILAQYDRHNATNIVTPVGR